MKLKTNTLINILNWIILSCIFLFLVFSLRYSVIVNDDIMDLINNRYSFCHGRFITELISTFIMVIIPNMFNIPLQNFAIVSEGTFKALFTTCLVYIISIAYFLYLPKVFKEKYYLVLPFLIVIYYSRNTIFLDRRYDVK